MDFPGSSLIPYIGISILMLVAVVIDIRVRRIPNWLTVPACVLGFVWHGAAAGWEGLGFAAGGFAVGFGILFVLWLIGGGGGGDVKLMGALGAWAGPLYTLFIFLGSTIFAVACVAVLMVKNGARSANSEEAATESNARTAVKQYVPYAVPVTMAVWSVFIFQLLKAI